MAPLVSVPHSSNDYNKLVATLDSLIDTVGNDEHHPLVSLMEVIGVLIVKYEDENVPEIGLRSSGHSIGPYNSNGESL